MRSDLSNKLIHLSRGRDPDPSKHHKEAARNLRNILQTRRLIGGTGYIRGPKPCVCFSEAPISALAQLLAAGHRSDFRYQPYGIMLEKTSLYRLGGRPVIYGPDADFMKLPVEMRFRHVRFELNDPVIDHTAEREWRIEIDELAIEPSEVAVIVPDLETKNLFAKKFQKDGWHFTVLSDLGASVAGLKR
jgi:hypothetical protein